MSEFKDDDRVKAIIAGQLAKYNTIKFGEVEVRVRSAIKKGLRDRIVGLANKAQNGEIESIDDEFYEAISQMCVDEPWTHPEVWRYVDEETGMIPKVFEMIIEQVVGAEKQSQSFRKRS